MVLAYNVSMMKTFDSPKIGSVVKVKTDWSDYFRPFDASTRRQSEYVGTVVRSERYDDPRSFRLTTGDKSFPIRVIDLDHVVSLVYEDGSKGSQSVQKKIEVTSWEVKSDSRKGGYYTVTREGSHFSCTCIGFGFRKSCRHVLAVKSKVA